MNQETLRKEIAHFLAFETPKMIPQLSIDCVIFSFHEDKLKVLLLRGINQEKLNLPSGFIYQDEDLDAAALRNLKERTGLDQLFLQQFHAFGKTTRCFPNEFKEGIAALGIDQKQAEWFFKRFVTIGYYALVNYQQTNPQTSFFSEGYSWADVKDLPPLILDHQELVETAMEILKKDILTKPIGLQLLPTSFTIPQFHQLYEIILQRKIDRRNFRKKMLQSNILIPLNEQKEVKGHRFPHLYRFDKETYEASLRGEVKMGF